MIHRPMLSHGLLSFLVVFACSLAALTSAAWAQDSVGRGKKALTEQGELPWYDPATDQPVFGDVPDGSEIKRPQSSRSNRSNRGINTSDGAISGGVAAYIFWGIALLIFLLFVGILLWAFFKMDRKEKNDELPSVSQIPAKQTRAEKLPFQINQATGDLLATAKDYFAKGDYRNAIIHLYSHVLITLDDRGHIRLTRGKTNRQYLMEIRNHDSIANYLESCMIPFEEAFFGARPVNSEVVGNCLNGFDHFQSNLTRTSAVD